MQVSQPSKQGIHCLHCGTHFKPIEQERFCCHGCYYVAQLIEENGLLRFYELKGKHAVPPVGTKVFQSHSTLDLKLALQTAETTSTANSTSARFSIEGISCIGCVWLIEAIFKRQNAAIRTQIEPRTQLIELHWHTGQFDIERFAHELHKIGYSLTCIDAEAPAPNNTQQLNYRLGLCGFFLLNTMLFTLPVYLGMGREFFLTPLFQLLSALFATLSLSIGGGYFIKRAWTAARNKVLHIDLPIAGGLLAAYAGSMLGWLLGYQTLLYFDFVATFVFLMLLGRWLQEYALERNQSYLKQKQVGPRGVTILGGENDGAFVAAETVTENTEYCLEPGQINPVAAELLNSAGLLSLEWINGEAEPVAWNSKHAVPAGAINVSLQGLRLRARESWNDSLLAQLLQDSQDSFNDLRLQGILKWYLGLVLIIASLGSLTWLITTGDPLKTTQVLISVLVVSCPCALGIALPMCDELAVARLRRAGLFIKNAQIWERLRQVKTVVFDKTGTLTMDVPRLVTPQAVEELDPCALEALGHLVANNLHPIARSLRAALLSSHATSRQIDFTLLAPQKETSSLTESIGQGVTWMDAANNEWTLGKPEWKATSHRSKAHTVLRQNGLLVAEFDFIEDIRDDAKAVITSLGSRKIESMILSGDIPERVRNITNQVGLSSLNYQAACTPQHKADWIHQNAAKSALMIGDGANDRLAFDAAICRGTPVVDRSILQSTADFFFFGRSLQCIPLLIQTAARRQYIAKLIFTFAVLYNMVTLTICLMGNMHPLAAAILMPLSSIATLAIAWLGLGNR